MIPPTVGAVADEVVDLPEEAVSLHQRHEAAGRVEKKRVEGNGPLLLPDDPAGLPPDPGEPFGNLIGVSDCCREKQKVDSCREINHDLLPDDPAVVIPEKMRLVEDDQVAVQIFPAVHHVVELVPKDLGRADEDRGIGVLLRVAGHNADVGRVETVAEFDPLGVGERLQGGGVPASAPLQEDGAYRLLGNPGFSRTGRRRHETVGFPDRVECGLLEGIRAKRRLGRLSDLRKDRLQGRFGFRFHTAAWACACVASHFDGTACPLGPVDFSGCLSRLVSSVGHEGFYHEGAAA